MDFIMRQITPTTTPLPLFKPMAQSWQDKFFNYSIFSRWLVTVLISRPLKTTPNKPKPPIFPTI
jgi:hypothetical protein